MQFEINGQNYFLSFVEDERRWYVFAPTATGVNRIPVYVDAPSAEKIVIVDENNQTLTH